MFNKTKNNKIYWVKNDEKYNTRKRLRYATDPIFRQKVSKQHRDWILKNPIKYRLQIEKIEGKRLKKRFLILKRDKFTCQYCGRKAPNVILEIDHIHPKSKDGENNIENLITACLECNNGKRDILL